MTTEQQTQAPAAATVPAAPASGAPAAGSPANIEAVIPEAKAAPEIEVTEETGDAGLDLALAKLGGVGLGRSHPAMAHAAKTGDFSLVRAVLAEKGEAAKGIEPYLKVAEQSLERQRGAETERADKTKAAVFSVAGSEQNWRDAQAWAAKNASPEERTELNAMLAGGPIQAKLAARFIVDAFSRSKGAAPATDQPGKSAVKPGAARASGADKPALSPLEFQRAVGALTAKQGTARLHASPEYQELLSRRKAFRG